MSLCVNPACTKPQNSPEDLFCQTCGTELLMEGRYRVLSMLGAGGCGKTYEVIDRDHHRKVLKILTNNDPKYVELFQREAQLLSQLNHPGIPTVEPSAYFTITPKNSTEVLHCLVMEKIVGLDLQNYLRQRGQPIEQKIALQWIHQLALILQTIHHQEILHRDIKPSNIMLKADGNLALVDFGTARSMTSVFSDTGPIPATRIISAMYTPDEQIKGHPVKQSDFFALGRTLVFLLTARDLGDFYDPLTSEFKWHQAVPSLTPSLQLFIDRLMAPRPADRPSSAEEILHQVRVIYQELFPPHPQGSSMAYQPTQVASHPESAAAYSSATYSSSPSRPLEPISGFTSAPPHRVIADVPSVPSVPPPVISRPPSVPSVPSQASNSGGYSSGNNAYEPTVSSDFVARCQLKLAEAIGPMARVICQQTLSKQQSWLARDFVAELAQHIRDPQLALVFRQSLLS